MNSIPAASRFPVLPQKGVRLLATVGRLRIQAQREGGRPRFEAKLQSSRTFHGRLLMLALIAAISLPGCVGFGGMMSLRHRDPMAGAPRLRNASNPQLEELITHLNDNTNRIQSWRCNNVEIHANHFSLSGTLAVEKGNHVRLVVSSPMGNEVDMGSNNERLWIWSRRLDPAFVTCKHENVDVARQQLGIPFEPTWLMQALGVAPLSTANFKMEVEPSNHQARLVEQVVSAHGQPLRRAVLVDLKNGTVLEHSLYDYDGNRVALAKLSRHRLDKSTGAVLPHRVRLDCPQSQMSMTMDLHKVEINPKSIPSVVWEMPPMPGYEVVNLDAGLPPSRIAVRSDNPVSIDTIETARLYEDELPEDRRPIKRAAQRAGHAKLSVETEESDESDESNESAGTNQFLTPISNDEWDK